MSSKTDVNPIPTKRAQIYEPLFMFLFVPVSSHPRAWYTGVSNLGNERSGAVSTDQGRDSLSLSFSRGDSLGQGKLLVSGSAGPEGVEGAEASSVSAR